MFVAHTHSFISAVTAGVQLQAETVDLATHKTASGADFYTINPKGNVPALVLEDGTVLNENAAVLQWIADQKPGTVAPPALSPARYKVVNALSYLGTEVHANIAHLFNAKLGAELREYFTAGVNRRFDALDKQLTRTPYLTGATATIADFYLYIILSWTGYVGLSLDKYEHLRAFSARVGALDTVKAAHARMATSPATTL